MTAALTYPNATEQPTRVVLRAAPRREPPFDDEVPTNLRPSRQDRLLPFARPVAELAPTAWRPAVAGEVGLPDPAQWSRRLLIGMIEAAGGRRPLHQLAALLSPSVATGLGGDFERGRRHWLHRAGVRSVRASRPTEGIAEISAVLDVGDRARAVALRIEAWHGRWRCVRIQLG